MTLCCQQKRRLRTGNSEVFRSLRQALQRMSDRLKGSKEQLPERAYLYVLKTLELLFQYLLGFILEKYTFNRETINVLSKLQHPYGPNLKSIDCKALSNYACQLYSLSYLSSFQIIAIFKSREKKNIQKLFVIYYKIR